MAAGEQAEDHDRHQGSQFLYAALLAFYNSALLQDFRSSLDDWLSGCAWLLFAGRLLSVNTA